MKFKARLRRVLAGALAAVLALATTGTAYADTTSGVDVVSAPSTVTVHVYNNNNAAAETAGTGDEIENPSATFGTAIEGATLSYYKVGELVQYTTNDSTSLKYAVSANAVNAFGWSDRVSGNQDVTIAEDGTDVTYYLFDASELSNLLTGFASSDFSGKGVEDDWKSVKTDPNGSASTSDDLSGLYLFIGNGMPEGVTTEVAPFFVSAPLPGNDNWNTHIHVYPKVQTAGALSISKTVNGTESVSANSGTSLNYKIVVTIPAEAKNFDSFKIEDTLPTGLTVDGYPIVSSSEEVTLQPDDYQLQSDNSKIEFSLVDDGLDVFDQAGKCTLTISYNAYINQNATLATAITNTAKLTYTYVGGAASEDSDSATVYTYGIDLTKTFEGATEYPSENAQFGLYTDSGCNQPVAVDGGNGVYWVDSSSSATAMSVVKSETTQDGTLTIKGLAAGTYYLKETAAPQGYGKIQDPITIVIDEGDHDALNDKIEKPQATVNGVQATIAAFGNDKAGLVQLTVENQQLLFGFLPRTGDVGTFIFIAAGIGLVCAAVVYLTSRRRKNVSNSR